MSKLINVYREADTVLVLSIAVLMFCCLWPMSASAQASGADVKPAAELLQAIANRAAALQRGDDHCSWFTANGVSYSQGAGMDVCPESVRNNPGSSYEAPNAGSGARGGMPGQDILPSFNTSSRAPADVLGEVQSRLQSLQLNGLGDGGVKPGVSQSIGAPAASSPVHSDPIPPAVSYAGSNTTSSADIAAIRSLLEEVLKRITLLTSQ